MAVFNRRLVLWLLKAYVKRWGKFILLSFVVGLVFFFILKQFLFTAIISFTSENKQFVGVVGAYTINTIPLSILNMLSEGLTTVDHTGTPRPGIASSWKITDNGKTYTFTLKKNLHFTDGTPVTSSQINLHYSDVTIARPDPYTIAFHLRENFSPFLVTVSKPIFRKNFIGIGPYTMRSLKLNGSFIESLTLRKADKTDTKIYQFYPTQDALKIAFMLGEVSTITGLSDISFNKRSFDHFANAKVTKDLRYDLLVTLFYNTQDGTLSNKELRDAFSYLIPTTFSEGERAYTPIAPSSWAYSNTNIHQFDSAHASVLLDAAGGASKLPVFTINALTKYDSIAKIIQKSFASVGIKTKIVLVDSIPQNFEMFLGDFTLPQDPDQYTLWHSFQANNITNFNSDKRIDKLLEDGRQTVDMGERIKIYTDFQKYLLDEQPASFLYFPYDYTVTRK